MRSDAAFWLDAHFNPQLAEWVSVTFSVAVKSPKELDLNEADDRVIFDAGRRFSPVVIVMKDSDFVELADRLGPPPQVLWMTVGNVTTAQLRAVLQQTFEAAVTRLNAGEPVVEISRL